ncbi:fluoride efflux transporter FluC [Falsarthrobacter nasiphocae]|uniref:Fluoride-specific ion channel n=1 Tax=Falsarthrobacter nasiphocae TaxID=189863 RepID=A0AAE3YIB6_9MICC|nr:CrcB family protein [Falsarthrobacter nasiphocae]MDR6892730.1 CrcB protein [Falsarthrobacter nasiphocae]
MTQPRAGVLGAVFAGGALGTLARWAVQSPFEAFPLAAAVATLCINTLGVAVLAASGPITARSGPTVKAFIGPGLMGGFTTFSAVMLLLAHPGAVLAALGLPDTAILGAAAAALWLVVSLALGWAAAGLGSRAGHRLAGARGARP